MKTRKLKIAYAFLLLIPAVTLLQTSCSDNEPMAMLNKAVWRLRPAGMIIRRKRNSPGAIPLSLPVSVNRR